MNLETERLEMELKMATKDLRRSERRLRAHREVESKLDGYKAVDRRDWLD